MEAARAAARAAVLAVQAAEAKSPTLFCRGLEGPSSAPGLSFASLAPTQRPTAACKIRIPSNHIPRQGDRHETHISNFGRSGVLLGASSAEAARPMGGNSNIIIAPTPPLQNSLPPQTNSGAAAARKGSRQYRGNQHHEPERAWRPRPANLRRCRAIRDPASTIRTKPCPVWATLGQRLPRTRGRQRRASIRAGFVGRVLEPIASCPLG